MNKTLSTLKFLIGWPLSVLALIFLIKLTLPKFSVIQSSLHSANLILIILSIIIFILYFILRSYLWKKILEYKGHKLTLSKTAYLWGFSEFKRYIPGNIWSLISRVSLFSQTGIDNKTVGLALLDEIQLIVIPCAIISLFSIPIILNPANSLQIGKSMQGLILGSLVGIIIYCIVIAYLIKSRTNKGGYIANLFLPSYSYMQKFKLTLISLVTFFVFGVATLIACVSIFNFDPAVYFALSAFFVFALLVGYLSFITPVGLGVREGVITFGLASMISLSTSGFLSIFSRIILIMSELIFLLLMLSLKTTEKLFSR
jgi:uncharacterized membrane protein YbhN (UPF0104 family)